MTDPDSNSAQETDAAGVSLSFLAQLRKRRVFQSAVAYAIVAWGITEVLDGVIDGLGWPDWLATLAVIVFVTGFPVAMFLAWVYDWTPDGIQRTAPSGPLGWLPAVLAVGFLVAGSAGLFWLINPSGIVRAERIGLAVLPCRYRGDPEFAFRGEGIAEVLSMRLSYAGGLFVPSFAGTLSAATARPGTLTLAGQLGVSYFVDCRVTEERDGITLTVSLVDVDTDESHELSSTSLRSLEILDSLRLVERAIGRELGLPAEDPAEAGQFTSSLEAFDDYLAGLQLLRGGTADAFELARKRFRSAQLASPFTMARIYEAIAVMARLEIDPPPEVSRPAALRAVALMLEEIEQGASVPAELYAARLQLANLEDRHGSGNPADDQQRRDWFERATALRPSFVEPYLSYADSLERAGRDSEARRFRKQAKEFMPMGR